MGTGLGRISVGDDDRGAGGRDMLLETSTECQCITLDEVYASTIVEASNCIIDFFTTVTGHANPCPHHLASHLRAGQAEERLLEKG